MAMAATTCAGCVSLLPCKPRSSAPPCYGHAISTPSFSARPSLLPNLPFRHSQTLLSAIAKPSLVAAAATLPSSPAPSHDHSAHTLPSFSPIFFLKWTSIACLSISVLRFICSSLSQPSLWMYCSWFFVIWPLPASLVFGIWAAFVALKQSKKKAKQWEQILALIAGLVWLILVPLGLRHGYVDGWPLLLFFLYGYFALISALIRIDRFGRITPFSVDKRWSSTPSQRAQIAFMAAVVVGHWLAAFQAPHLYFSWNWEWPSRIAAALLTLAMIFQYYATYFLVKYFDKDGTPRTLVVFGPYRFVRHPIYTSYMLLFAGFCVALRAYWSMAFLLIACFLYYEQRVKLEEEILLETYGQAFKAYRERVKSKYFPLLY